MGDATLESVIAPDGTPIGVWRAGQGPPLVLVHGATADHTRWRTVLPLLEPHFTVFALDRRGRGASGDASHYAIEREFDDVAAVVDEVGAQSRSPVDLLGHSFGGLCALEAAGRTSNLRRLVLYEPVGGDTPATAEILDRLDALMEAGQREEVVATFFTEVVGGPPAELERLRSLPAWTRRIEAAHTLTREVRAEGAYRLDRERFANVTVPALVLVGGDSPARDQAYSGAVADALPGGRLEVLPGQRHIAMDTAPELFAETVLAFLRQH